MAGNKILALLLLLGLPLVLSCRTQHGAPTNSGPPADNGAAGDDDSQADDDSAGDDDSSAKGDGTSGDDDSTGDDDDSTLPPADQLHGDAPAEALPVAKFEALNSDGTTRSSPDLIGHPTVLWFFPYAGTPV